MKVTLDRYATYIYLTEEEPKLPLRTRDVGGDIYVDFDDDGKPYGIEIIKPYKNVKVEDNRDVLEKE